MKHHPVSPEILKARRARAAARRVTTAVTAAPSVNFSDVARRQRKNKRRQKEHPLPYRPTEEPIKVTAGQPDRPAVVQPGTAREWTKQLNSQQPPSRSTEDMTDRNNKFDRDAQAARDAQEKRRADARAEARAESSVGATAPAANRADSERKADAPIVDGKPRVAVDTSAALDHASNKERAARQDGSRSSTADESDAVDAERARAKAADKPYYVRLEQGEENVVLNPSYQGGVKEDRPGQGTTVESPNTVTLNGGVQIKTGGAPGDKGRDLDSEQPARFRRAERRNNDSAEAVANEESGVDFVEDDFDGVEER